MHIFRNYIHCYDFFFFLFKIEIIEMFFFEKLETCELNILFFFFFLLLFYVARKLILEIFAIIISFKRKSHGQTSKAGDGCELIAFIILTISKYIQKH